MAGVVTIDDIAEFMGREGNDQVYDQFSMSAKYYDAMTKQDTVGDAVMINIDTAGQDSVTALADAGDLIEGTSYAPVRGFAVSKAVYGAMKFSRMSVTGLAGVGDSINLVNKKIKDMGTSLARQIDRQLIGSELFKESTTRIASGTVVAGVTQPATWTAQAVPGFAGTPVAIKQIFKDSLAEVRPGEAIDVFVKALGTNGEFRTVTVAQVNPIAARHVLVTLVSGVAPGTVASGANVPGITAATAVTLTGDRYFLRGTGMLSGAGAGLTAVVNSDIALTGLRDICSSDVEIYGIANGSKNWIGKNVNFNGPMYAPQLNAVLAEQDTLAASPATHVLMSKVAASAYASAQLSAGQLAANVPFQPSGIRRNVDGKIDAHGKGILDGSNIAVMGLPVLIDTNCPDNELFFINKDQITVHEWYKPGVVKGAGGDGFWNQTKLTYDFQFQGFLEQVTKERGDHQHLRNLVLAGF